MSTLASRLHASRSSSRQGGVRVAVALGGMAIAGVPFSVLVLFVESHWHPLLELDGSARDGLHRYALAHPAFVTLMRLISDSGSALAWQLVVVGAAAVLLLRRRVHLALFVIVTNLGSSLVNGFVKTAVVGYGVLLLVVLPFLDRMWRRVAVGVAVVMVAAIGFSRIALAAHFVSDVLAAYLLGLAWVALMASVFHVWARPQPQAPDRAGSLTRNYGNAPAADRESPLP